MRIKCERSRDARLECMMQNEVQSPEIGQSESHDIATHHSGEMRLHAPRCDVLGQIRKIAGIISNDRELRRVALIPGPGMSQLAQFNFIPACS